MNVHDLVCDVFCLDEGLREALPPVFGETQLVLDIILPVPLAPFRVDAPMLSLNVLLISGAEFLTCTCMASPEFFEVLIALRTHVPHGLPDDHDVRIHGVRHAAEFLK